MDAYFNRHQCPFLIILAKLFKLHMLGGLFLFYNLELFGKRLKEIRKVLKLNQKYIAQVTDINDKTIRRIENGKVLPQLDTLEVLSPIYKEDLISLLLEYRFDDYSVFCEIKNKVELKLDNGEQHTLHSEFKRLNILLSSTENPYYKNLINQLILFTEAAIVYKDNNNNNNTALTKLLKAIKITTPTFNLDNYTSFVYSSMELRILMNIAFVLNRLNNKGMYLEIMEFCVNAVDTDDELYPKLCHNLAGAYTRNKEYQKALDFSNMGIKSCQKNRSFNGLNILYYGKGFAEYYLGKSEHLKSLSLSISLCEAFGQDNLKKTIINNCKEILDINLSG